MQKLKKAYIFSEILSGLKTFFSNSEHGDVIKDNEEKFLNRLLLSLKNEKGETSKPNINEYMVFKKFLFD